MNQEFETWYKTAKRRLANTNKTNEYEDILSKLFLYAGSADLKEIEACYDLFSQILLRVIDRSSEIISNHSFKILGAGFNAYQQKAFREAEGYFSVISTDVSSSGANNLAYMIRRDEVVQPPNKYYSKALLLLRDGVGENEPFSIINTVLILAIKINEEKSWLLADKLVQRISPFQSNGIEDWWKILGLSNDPEGYLVHLWLLRHGKINESALGTYETLCAKVKTAYPSTPGWLFEKAVEVTSIFGGSTDE